MVVTKKMCEKLPLLLRRDRDALQTAMRKQTARHGGKRMQQSVYAAALAGFMLGQPLMAAEPAKVLDEVVVTATRSAEQGRKIPAKVEVISRQDLALTAGETVTEQLKKNASIDVMEYPGALAGIGIRGFRPETFGITKHSLVLIDGRPAGATNLATILTDSIERIEVLKGPASSLYGAEAMGGVVNIITTKSTGPRTGMAEIGFGSFGANAQKAALGGGIGKRLDFDLAARRFEQADDYAMGNGATRANTSYRTQNGRLRLGADLGQSWRLDMSGDLYQGRDIETPGDIAAGELKSGRKDIDRYGLDFTVGGKVGRNHQLSLTGYHTGEETANFSDYASDYSGWPVVTTVTVPTFRSTDSETDWLGLQLKDEYHWQGRRFIAGLDYQDIDKESRYYNQDGTGKKPYSPNEGRTNLAGYLETVWNLMDDRMTITGGGRYDTFAVATKATPLKSDFVPKSEDFAAFSPRAGLNYLFDQGFRLHTTVGKGFVPPSAWQLAGYSQGTSGITRGNPNLKAESSVTYDVGLGYELAELGLAMDLTYFHTDVDDKISTVTNGAVSTFENSLSAEMGGLETMFSFDNF